MRRALRWAVAGTASLVLIALATVAWMKLAPRPTPPGQAPLASLDEATFGQLRAAFDAAADRTRVLAILSPT